MTVNFIKPITTINGADSDNKPLHFFDKGFLLGGGHEPQYQDVTIAGQMSLTLLNAKADGLNYLKLYGGCEQRLLPEGYTQLEYIEATGTQYINTGIMANDNTDIGIVASDITSPSAQIFVAGAGSGSGLPVLRMVKFRADELVGVSIGGTKILSSSTGVTKFKAEVINKTFYFNGVAIGSSTDTINPEYPLELFRGKYGTRASDIYYSNFKCYSAYVKQNGVLVLNLIPAKRNSDNKVGMYDTVTDTFFTNSGTGTFTAGSAATPTPNIPQPIYCNNGEIKVRNKSGLPLGYQALEYLQSDGACYINLNRVPNNTDIIEQKFRKLGTATETCAWYGSMPDSSTLLPRIALGSYNQSGTFKIFGGINSTLAVRVADTNTHTIRFRATSSTEIEYTFDGVTDEGTIPSGTATTYSPALELTSYLFARHGTNGVQVYDNEGTAIYYHREYLANGTLALECIPAKRISDNVLGMYDTVSNTFLTNQGAGTLAAGPVDDSVEIYTDGTTETVTDAVSNVATCQNLLSVDTYKDTQEILSGAITRNVGVKVFNGSEDWTYENSRFKLEISDYLIGSSIMALIISHYKLPATDIGSIANGEARFGKSGVDATVSNSNILVIHDDNYTSLDSYKSWLAQQYANGTPVIIVYPLEEPTTETVTDQPLTIQEGTNVIEITQASMDNLELEAQYKAGVAVTITEVENANLDNSVTVTIS